MSQPMWRFQFWSKLLATRAEFETTSFGSSVAFIFAPYSITKKQSIAAWSAAKRHLLLALRYTSLAGNLCPS